MCCPGFYVDRDMTELSLFESEHKLCFLVVPWLGEESGSCIPLLSGADQACFFWSESQADLNLVWTGLCLVSGCPHYYSLLLNG